MDIDNLFNLDGKVAVITGGGDGMGKGCAQILASVGASIVVSYINLQKALTPELEEKMLRHTPIKRLREVSDIARAVIFFASPASSWISGQTLFVNGGGVRISSMSIKFDTFCHVS